MKTGDIYSKLHNGDHISDDELDYAIERFTSLENDLIEIGPHFHLAREKITHDLITLKGYKAARKSRNP